MFAFISRVVICFVVGVALGSAGVAFAQQDEVGPVDLPTIKFFYYGAGEIEWAFSAEPDRLQQHLAAYPESQTLFDSVTASVSGAPTLEKSVEQMNRWIESERSRFEESRQETIRIRKAEGIVAYLRAHDFQISNLVEALKRRSGAADVEVVAVHLQDEQENSTFKLQVVLVDPAIEIGRQGFNVNLRSPNVSYTTVTYALGVALYEVHDLMNSESSEEEAEENETELLPIPAPQDGPTLPST